VSYLFTRLAEGLIDLDVICGVRKLVRTPWVIKKYRKRKKQKKKI
jgi:hypothetical protein